MEELLSVLTNLNTKNEDASPSPADIKNTLKLMIGNDENDEFFENMWEFREVIYLLGAHYPSIKALVSNLEFYAENAIYTLSKELKNFKKQPNIKEMKTMLTKACCKKKQEAGSHSTTKSARRQLALQLDSSLDDDEVNVSASTSTASNNVELQNADPSNKKRKTVQTKGKKGNSVNVWMKSMPISFFYHMSESELFILLKMF